MQPKFNDIVKYFFTTKLIYCYLLMKKNINSLAERKLLQLEVSLRLDFGNTLSDIFILKMA